MQYWYVFSVESYTNNTFYNVQFILHAVWDDWKPYSQLVNSFPILSLDWLKTKVYELINLWHRYKIDFNGRSYVFDQNWNLVQSG